MSKTKKITSDVESLQRALNKTIILTEAAKYPLWRKEVAEGKTLLAFHEWRELEAHREMVFNHANLKGANCNRKVVEKLLAADELNEVVNDSGISVFIPKGNVHEVLRLLNRGVDAVYGKPEE